MDTIITIVYFEKNIVFGFHVCPNAPEEYIWQTAGDAYNCLARNDRINSKTKMIVIAITEKGPKVVVINDDQSILKKNINDFLEYHNVNGQPKKIDSIKVLHSKYKIEKYLPYIDVDCTGEIFFYFKEILSILRQENYQTYQLKSIIWEKILQENQQSIPY